MVIDKVLLSSMLRRADIWFTESVGVDGLDYIQIQWSYLDFGCIFSFNEDGSLKSIETFE